MNFGDNNFLTPQMLINEYLSKGKRPSVEFVNVNKSGYVQDHMKASITEYAVIPAVDGKPENLLLTLSVKDTWWYNKKYETGLLAPPNKDTGWAIHLEVPMLSFLPFKILTDVHVDVLMQQYHKLKKEDETYIQFLERMCLAYISEDTYNE